MNKLLLSTEEIMELTFAVDFVAKSARRKAKDFTEVYCSQGYVPEETAKAAGRIAASYLAKSETLERVLDKAKAALIAPEEEEEA